MSPFSLRNQENLSHYEVLEIPPDASPQEIRDAYLRLKSAFHKDSLALYSLMDPEETQSQVQKIEKAYETLSHPERRRDYDRSGDTMVLSAGSGNGNEKSPVPSASSNVHPLFPEGSEIDPLEAPVTDPGFSNLTAPIPHQTLPTAAPPPTPVKPPSPTDLGWVQTETEWRGPTLRRVREARALSIEELADFTKISKTYLKAIEEENFDKLPAPVYLRGFLVQLSRKLQIPAESVATVYVARYKQACPQKS